MDNNGIVREIPDEVQRWTSKRRGGAGRLDPGRGYLGPGGGSQARPDRGGHRGLERQISVGAENALRSRPRDEEAFKDEQIKKLQRKVGELVLDMDIMKEAMKGHPFAPKTFDE